MISVVCSAPQLQSSTRPARELNLDKHNKHKTWEQLFLQSHIKKMSNYDKIACNLSDDWRTKNNRIEQVASPH